MAHCTTARPIYLSSGHISHSNKIHVLTHGSVPLKRCVAKLYVASLFRRWPDSVNSIGEQRFLVLEIGYGDFDLRGVLTLWPPGMASVWRGCYWRRSPH